VTLAINAYSHQNEVVVSKIEDKQMIFKGFRYNNLYLVDFTFEDANLMTCLFTKTSLGWLWHGRLAHVRMNTLNKLLKKELVRGLKDVKFEKDKPCSACQAGKQDAILIQQKLTCQHQEY
jgi:hypothetical protein